MNLHYTALVTLLTVLLQIWILFLVGLARTKYGVKAPAIIGNEDFERTLRGQANTIESLLMFLPSLWLCAIYLGDCWAAGGGLLWLLGRVLYVLGYRREARQRELGFTLSSVAILALVLAAGYGLLRTMTA